MGSKSYSPDPSKDCTETSRLLPDIPNDGHTAEPDPTLELRRRLMLSLPALAIGLFLAAADQTIVVSSYGKIGSEFNALDRTSWIATALDPCPSAFSVHC